MPHRRGFTLIELLVVISIIALLMAIFMPTLQRAKKSERSVACQAHLCQWGLMMKLYADDNAGNGHHGTAFGGPRYVTFDFGQAISFDGIDDYVEIQPFKYTHDLGEFTVSFWFKVHDVNATATNNGFPTCSTTE